MLASSNSALPNLRSHPSSKSARSKCLEDPFGPCHSFTHSQSFFNQSHLLYYLFLPPLTYRVHPMLFSPHTSISFLASLSASLHPLPLSTLSTPIAPHSFFPYAHSTLALSGLLFQTAFYQPMLSVSPPYSLLYPLLTHLLYLSNISSASYSLFSIFLLNIPRFCSIQNRRYNHSFIQPSFCFHSQIPISHHTFHST